MSKSGGIVAAAWLPGMPQLLAIDPAPDWQRLAAAARAVGAAIRSAAPDVVVLLSTQWFTVLGHQFQCDPRLHGTVTDPNWYRFDYGRVPYNLTIDTNLADRWAAAAAKAGLQARRTNYPGFPIDTGTAVTAQLCDPENVLRWCQVSCNLYAAAEDLTSIGSCAAEAVAEAGQRAVVVVSSGLSARPHAEWITPTTDRISDPALERLDRQMLDLLSAGHVGEALRRREEYAAAATADSQLRCLSFLSGALQPLGPADVKAYGAIWGTGAAVMTWGL